MAKETKVVEKKYEGIIGKVLESLSSFGKATTIKQRSREYIELEVISGFISRIQGSYKDKLIEKQVYECYPEFEMKLEYQAPKTQSHIDSVKLANYLIKQNRLKDLLAIINISEKQLTTLADGEALAKKYRVADEDTKAGLKAGKMTKAELKALNVTA